MAAPERAAPAQHAAPAPPPPSGWVVGLSLFAGVLMIITGLFNALEGIVALFKDEVYAVGLRYVFAFDLTTWGWIHLLIGIAVAAAGAAVIYGRTWGRVVGIGIALLSMFANFLFIPYYPIWSLLIIALNVFIIWALCVYNRDAAMA